MVFWIALALIGLAVLGFGYYVHRWAERDQREVMERGKPFIAYVLIAEDHIYRPSRERSESYAAGARLLIALEPESPELHAALRSLTDRLLALSDREPQTEAEREVVPLVRDESFRTGRIPIPKELTGGRLVYSYDGSILREHLPEGFLTLPYIHCKAVPGETGNIYMTAYPGRADLSKKPLRLRADQIRPLATGYGDCSATEMIACGGCKVAIMYRQAGDRDADSGWRFLSGYESNEYLSNPDNHAVYDVNIIANCDPEIVPLLDAPVGSAFVRENGTGPFALVHDFKPAKK